jgi:hypothetical protein
MAAIDPAAPLAKRISGLLLHAETARGILTFDRPRPVSGPSGVIPIPAMT